MNNEVYSQKGTTHKEITNKKDAKTEPSATEIHKNTLQRWADPNNDGRRLNRMIRYLETKMKKCKDDDRIIKYANSIGYLTSKKIEIADMVLGILDIVRKQENKLDRTSKYV